MKNKFKVSYLIIPFLASTIYFVFSNNFSKTSQCHFKSQRSPASAEEDKNSKSSEHSVDCLVKSKHSLIDEIEHLVLDKEKLLESYYQLELQERTARDHLYALSPQLFGNSYYQRLLYQNHFYSQPLYNYNYGFTMPNAFQFFDVHQFQLQLNKLQAPLESQFDLLFNNFNVGLNPTDSLYSGAFAMYTQQDLTPIPASVINKPYFSESPSVPIRHNFNFGLFSPHGIIEPSL